MNNTRFATLVHILVLLARSSEEWLSSDYIAGSINTNPVMVRRELLELQNRGFVESKRGKDGGNRLMKSTENITLAEIFQMVKDEDFLGRKNPNPNPKCNVGKQINEKLSQLFGEVDVLLKNFLGDQTLADFSEKFD